MTRAFFALLIPATMALACGPNQLTSLGATTPPPVSTPISSLDSITIASLQQHLAAQKSRLPAGFSSTIAKPFIVVGNLPPGELQSFAEKTVRWAVDKLKQDFFTKDPTNIIDIWLFADKTSYEYYCTSLFSHPPTTPFGFYLAEKNALIMNIATGGGTLVHEIVHPFMAANSPECPSWLNEGLASLFEQSSERDGHIVGLTNWRLAGLQKAIASNDLPSFKNLLSLDTASFYGADSGRNYAQARYLCYYLQEKGLLVPFFNRFLANHAADPTGLQTLLNVLEERNENTFQRRFEDFVVKLRFP